MSIKTKLHERTLILLKPDGVQRGLVGEILSRFERKGLKIIGMKMTWPTRDMALRHYDMPKKDKLSLGERTIAAYKERGIEIKESPIQWAEKVQKRLVSYLTTGPIIAFIIEGAHAIEHVRKIRGATNPLSADIGSITADLTIDSYFIADEDERAIRNLVHASGSREEAEREIKLWFKKEEIYDYDLAIEKILYLGEWEQMRKELVKPE